MNAILARYPKTRPPLPTAYQAIHEQHYKANRQASYHTTGLSSRMEAWMHRQVAADVRGRTRPSTLEIGAGTLNHLPYEPDGEPYDIVARAGLALAGGGVLRVAIPNEGTILWRLGTALTGAEFRLRYGLDYQVLMRHEHVNTADEIEAVLRWFFADVRVALCGIHRCLALYRFLECRGCDRHRAAAHTGWP